MIFLKATWKILVQLSTQCLGWQGGVVKVKVDDL